MHAPKKILACAIAAILGATTASGARATEEDEEARAAQRVRVGALAGAGFPRPLAFEGVVKVGKAATLGAEYSLLPAMTIAGVRTSFWALAATARVFPFGGPFFVGLRGGKQHLEGDTSLEVPTYGAIREAMSADTWFVNPHVGLLWTWSPGFTFAVDAGAQIPIAWTSASTLPPGITATQTLDDIVHTMGGRVIPTVDLLRAGWLF